MWLVFYAEYTAFKPELHDVGRHRSSISLPLFFRLHEEILAVIQAELTLVYQSNIDGGSNKERGSVKQMFIPSLLTL